MRFIDLAETREERTDVVPLNVVTQRVTEKPLGGNSVVMIQLEWHAQPPREGRRLLALT
jgi:hypothetical protein